MSEWQPIETAPKDGTLVLVADVFGATAAAFDGSGTKEEYEFTVGEKITDEEWQEELQNYSFCWVSVDPISGDTEYLEPSHWMPIPMQPSNAGGGIREGHSR